MKLTYIIFALLLVPYFVNSQSSELVLKDFNAQDDVVIELESHDSADPDYNHMTIGFNQSNQGWIRTLANKPLRFFTNGLNRMTVQADGQVRLGTQQREKFDIGFGRLRMTTDQNDNIGLDLITGSYSDYKGGLSYTANAGSIDVFSLQDNDIMFKTNQEIRMTINEFDNITIADVGDTSNGSGGAQLLADSNGKLVRGTIGSNELNFTENLTSGNFKRWNNHFTEFGPHQFRGFTNVLDPQIPNVSSHAFAAIDIPSGSIIKKVIINYIDRDIMEMNVKMIRSNNNSVNNAEVLTLLQTVGMPSSTFDDVITEEVDINNWLVGPQANEKTNIFITMFGNNLGISSIVVEYIFLENLN